MTYRAGQLIRDLVKQWSLQHHLSSSCCSCSAAHRQCQIALPLMTACLSAPCALLRQKLYQAYPHSCPADRKLYWDSILEQVTQELRRQRGGVLERELLRQKQGDNGDKAAAETMFAVLGVEGDPAPPEPATATATADPPGAAAASASEPNSSCHIPSTQKVCEESFMRQKPKTSLQGFKQLLQGIKVRCQTAGTAAGQTIARAAAAPFARQTRSSSRISRKADRQVPISSSPPPPTRQTLASTNTPPSSCPSMQERMYMVVDQVRGTCHFSICNVVNTTNQVSQWRLY